MQRTQGIINAAVDQLAGDAAEAGRKTVRHVLKIKLGCSNSRAHDREVAHRIIDCTPWATRCGSHSGAAATRACKLDVA